MHRLIKKPRFAECASSLGLSDAAILDVQSEIVANATTDGAGNIMYDFNHEILFGILLGATGSRAGE